VRVTVIRRNRGDHNETTDRKNDATGKKPVINFPVTSNCRLLLLLLLLLQICSCVKCTKRDRPTISPVVSVFTPPSFVLWNGEQRKLLLALVSRANFTRARSVIRWKM